MAIKGPLIRAKDDINQPTLSAANSKAKATVVTPRPSQLMLELEAVLEHPETLERAGGTAADEAVSPGGCQSEPHPWGRSVPE